MNDSDRPTAAHPPSEAELFVVEAAVTAGDQPPFPLPPQDGATQSVVVQAAVWTVVGYGVMQALRFGCNLILTRLVEKYVFGVMATVSVCLTGLHMFSDLGVKQCVVNSPRGDEERFLNTAWTIQVIRGIVLWCAAFLICGPLSWLYEQPEMLWLIPIVGVTAICDGLTSTAAFTMMRRLHRRALVVRELGAYAGAMSIVIVWLLIIKRHATASANVADKQMLAAVSGNVMAALFEMALSYTLIRGARIRLAWDSTATRELMHFGGWVLVSTAFTFFANTLDRLYVGKISQEVMADYHIAAQIARTPAALIFSLGHQLVFPLYCKLIHAGIPLKNSFAKLHAVSTGLGAYLISGAFTAGSSLIWLAYQDKYHNAGEYVRWLSMGAWFTILQTSSEVALLAQGKTRQLAVGQIVKLILLAPLLLAGYHWKGILGVIMGYTIAEAARYVILSAALAKQGLPVFKLDLWLTVLIALSVGIAGLIGPMCEMPGDHFARYGLRFLVESSVLTLFWAGVLAAWWSKNGRSLLAVIRNPG